MSPDYPWMPNWGCSFPIKLEHLMNFLLTILDHSGEEATVSKLGKTKGCKDQTWNFIIDTGIWDVCRAKTHLCHQNQESLVSAPGGASWSCWSHRSDLQLLVRSVGSHSLCKHQDKLVELIQYSKSVIQWSDYLRKKTHPKSEFSAYLRWFASGSDSDASPSLWILTLMKFSR